MKRIIDGEEWRVIIDSGWCKVRIVAADGVRSRFVLTATGMQRRWKKEGSAASFILSKMARELVEK